MEMRLSGKVITVTGGAKGIGAAIVRLCGREGALPVVFDRDECAISRLEENLKQEGIEISSVNVDLTDIESSAKALRSVAGRLGHIDAIVNNAGLNDRVGLEHGTPQLFAKSLNDNLVHYFAMTQAALPFLKVSKGSIVNIASKVAVTGQGGTSGYAAAKGAILELTKGWAAELWSEGIRVNAIVPAEVMTPQYQEWIMKTDNADGDLGQIAARIPLGHRFTEAEEIAAMVVFLLSGQTFTTGQEIYIDGGYVHLDRAITRS